jgi:sarcosine oxidase, subunit gamma
MSRGRAVTAEVFERSPLAPRAGDLSRIGAREVPFLTQLSVRSRSPQALRVPVEPNTWTSLEDDREALWLGPDEWLVVGRPGSGASFHRGAWARFGFEDRTVEGLTDAASIVDVSANRTVVELHRDDVHDPRRLLEQGCTLDLHPSRWREGMCAQTLVAHVPVILQERGDATRVFARPSFANHLVDWLLTVA